jgi:hypothetical protein
MRRIAAGAPSLMARQQVVRETSLDLHNLWNPIRAVGAAGGALCDLR